MHAKPYVIDLSEQMAVCDANYIRLLKLLGDMRSFNSACIRFVNLPHLGTGIDKKQISVCFEVLEEFKYTTTISIKQLYGKPDVKTGDNNKVKVLAHYNAPEMIVRVYHDAKTAEVTSYQNHKYFKAIYQVPNQFMYQSDEKEQLNLFLAEWLNLCIKEGMSNPEELHLERLTCI